MWIEHIRTSVDNYLVFQDKMIMPYTQMWSNYPKTSNIKTNEQIGKNGRKLIDMNEKQNWTIHKNTKDFLKFNNNTNLMENVF